MSGGPFPSSQRRGGCADSQRAGGADGVVSSAEHFAGLTTPSAPSLRRIPLLFELCEEGNVRILWQSVFLKNRCLVVFPFSAIVAIVGVHLHSFMRHRHENAIEFAVRGDRVRRVIGRVRRRNQDLAYDERGHQVVRG